MIPARQLYRAWKCCRSAGVDLFALQDSRSLVSVHGWSALNIPSEDTTLSFVLESLRGIELRHLDQSQVPSITRLVATVPPSIHVAATTRDVAERLVRSASREILVVGFSVREPAFLQLLWSKAADGVEVTVISDRGADDARQILEGWPATGRPLRAYRGVEPVQGQSLVHAKTIVVDRRHALLGSANFTAGGFRNNIELGFEVSGATAADIVALVEQLITRRWLEAVGGRPG